MQKHPSFVIHKKAISLVASGALYDLRLLLPDNLTETHRRLSYGFEKHSRFCPPTRETPAIYPVAHERQTTIHNLNY